MFSRSLYRGDQPAAEAAFWFEAISTGASPGRPVQGLHGHLSAGDIGHLADHFAHRIAAALPQVEGAAGAAGRQVLERPHVGVGKVADVDVVADARPVRRGVVRAVHMQRGAGRPRAASSTRGSGGFRVVPFADPAAASAPAALK